MNYFYAFLFAGFACSIAQVILDNTKLTPGHITSIYAVAGSILSFFNVYDKLIDKFKSGASIIISNFGASLYTSAYQGYLEDGFLGIFSNMLSKSSLVICVAIISAFIIAIAFKPKN